MGRPAPGRVALHLWDATDHLRTEADIRSFLEAGEEKAGGDAQFMALVQATAALARKRWGLAQR